MCKTHPHTLVFCKNVLLSRHGRTVDGINANKAKNKAFLNLLLQQTGKKRVCSTHRVQQLATKSFPNGKKKRRQFSSKQFSAQPYVPLTATSPSPSDLFLSLSLSLSLSHFSCDSCEASANQKHLQKIKSACWCLVCRAFTCLTDTRGEGEGKGGEKRKRAREATCYRAPRH